MDHLLLIAYGMALVVGAQLYALTGWPPPGLIDKTAVMPPASHAA